MGCYDSYGKEVTWELKKGIMGRPGLGMLEAEIGAFPTSGDLIACLYAFADAARYLVEFTGIPMTPEEAMKAMEKRQEELFTQVGGLPHTVQNTS